MDLFLHLNIEVCGNCCFWSGSAEVDCSNVVLYDMSWNLCCCSWCSTRWPGSSRRAGAPQGCSWLSVPVTVFVSCSPAFARRKVFRNRLCLPIEKNLNLKFHCRLFIRIFWIVNMFFSIIFTKLHQIKSQL